MSSQPLLFIEFNELNFESLEQYISRGRGELPTFARLFGAHGYARTISERAYSDLEPWIQWVTAHTGLSLAEHQVFRLGDIINHDIRQIWEMLEDQGLKVGAISPMNAANRLRSPAFFIPDPWTKTTISAPPIIARMFRAIVQAVNDNAQGRLTARSAADLLAGATLAAAPVNYWRYLKMAVKAGGRPWYRAMVLDLLLSDLFAHLINLSRPQFASLFLNAAAHIQHHYMFSSGVYDGALRNPVWYIAAGEDPVLDVYQLYDRILGSVQRRFPSHRIMLATGLHQDPHDEVTFYWRLIDPAEFLKRINVPFVRVEPRMSRDFLVVCEDAAQAEAASLRLNMARAADGTPLFEVDNRGEDLFVMLTYPHDIPADAGYSLGNEWHSGLRDAVAFVAIKNGQHNGVGYFADTAATAQHGLTFPLAEIPARIGSAMSLLPSFQASQVA